MSAASPRIQRLTPNDRTVLESPGKRSEQIVWPENAPSARITLTRVTMEPGATSPRHSHVSAEQTWLIERGRATLLMRDGRSDAVAAGDVVITPPGEVHGVTNTGDEPFVYLSVTTPPEDFTNAYQRQLPARADEAIE
jgi:quercetin dioxygenase-like cupin family protein